MIKIFLELYGIKWYSNNLFEADDVIGIVSEKAKRNNYIVDIISGDKDMLQLVDENVNVHISKKGVSEMVEYNINNFFDIMKLHPHQIVDFKGIAGDSSDNIKGIKGIGEIGAINLLSKYDNLEEIIKNVNDLPDSLKKRINDNVKTGILSKKIAMIMRSGNLENLSKDDIDFKKPKINELIIFFRSKKINRIANIFEERKNE